MVSRSFAILFIIFASLVEYIGDSSLKIFSRTNKIGYLFSGTLSYLFIVWLLIYILKFTNVAFMNLAWDGTSALLETILAMIFLGERLSNNVQYLGAIMIIVGMLALNYGPIPF